jgi:UDP-2-acetamido-3-amino-2,3-dideoxy-glucuronate N-acetyltransferase
MTFFVHPKGLCESANVGPGTRIWAFAHVLPGAKIGADCNICDGVFIENDVAIGDRVTVKCGVQLWDGITIGHDVFIGPNATFTNDRFPRSRVWPGEFQRTIVENGASIGANATILPGVRIGAEAMVGAGSVVTRDVPARGVVVGNPARLIRYTDTPIVSQPDVSAISSNGSGISRSNVRGVQLVDLAQAIDMRGNLNAAEVHKHISFAPQRVFTVSGVTSEKVRGEHAHRECEQFLMCVSGSVNAIVDDGIQREEYVLDKPNLGLYMPSMIWGTQYKYSPGAVLLVLASLPYDPADYIRDYSTFAHLAQV